MSIPAINSDEAILQILRDYRRIVVVGLSNDPLRPSHGVARYMRGQGYTILPVNPSLKEWEGLMAYDSLASVPTEPEVVDIFRRSELAGAVVDEAVAAGARAVWLQEGVIDEAAAQRAHEAGLLVVMDRCILKEHSRLRRAGRL